MFVFHPRYRRWVVCALGFSIATAFGCRASGQEKLIRFGGSPEEVTRAWVEQSRVTYRVLLERPQHLSADQIIDKLRVNGSAVSKATVYNTLNLFSQRGLIKEVMVDPVRKFYDSTTHAHHHFYNVDSGQLSDIPDEQVRFQDLPELPEGTERESVEVLIKVRDRAS